MFNNLKATPGQYEYFHFTPVQIRFNDIDIMGHVNNAIFQHYFDFARLGYFRDVFGEQMSWNGTSLILASLSIDYHHMVHLNDEIIIASRTIRLGNKSLQMVQEVQKLPDREIMASSSGVMVAWDASRGCSVPVPGKWKEQIMVFEKEVGLKQT